jgi:hypothetical protein
MSETPISYPCKFCFKNFLLKTDYDEHVISCEFLKTRAKLRNNQLNRVDDIVPPPRMMYELVKYLAAKCDKLEKQVDQLRKTNQRERKRIDLLVYLNEQQQHPQTTYKIWLKNIEITNEDLQYTIEHNIIKGVCNVLENVLFTDEKPLAAFAHKRGYIYIFDEGAWTIMSENAINCLFDILSNRMLRTYNKWEATQPETEANINEKTRYKQKILGLSICDETKYRKFRIWLYHHLKTQTQLHVTEYDFV